MATFELIDQVTYRDGIIIGNAAAAEPDDEYEETVLVGWESVEDPEIIEDVIVGWGSATHLVRVEGSFYLAREVE